MDTGDKVIAVCDREIVYARHLIEYIEHHCLLPYEVMLFSSAQKMLQNLKTDDIALLIIAETSCTDEILQAGIASLLILNESDQYLGDSFTNVSKYQSMEAICSTVMKMCMQNDDALPGSVRHIEPMKIIGVYTPVTRCLQTTFTLSLGQLLSRKDRVLYLNFENYSGFSQMLNRQFRGSSADLLYFNECSRNKLAAQLVLVAEHLGSLDFIPPMNSFLEMRGIKAEQWVDLFRTIEKVTDYKYLLLDLTESADGLFELLRQCDYIFMIVRDDAISRAKILNYEAMLKNTHFEDIFARTRRWELPVFRQLPASMENLTHGELADYIKKRVLPVLQE